MANISYGVNILPKTNNAYTIGNSDYKWSNIYTVQINGTNVSDLGTVQDVQINGNSILNNGVANIPVATNQVFGAVKTGQFGIGISNNGNLMTTRAQINDIKAGTNQYLPIVPDYQHRATFYGLAKAAGDTTQSASNNAVGTYTDSAKTAIKTMLDIPTLVSQLTNDSGFLTSVPIMTGATSSTAGASGLVPTPTTGDVDKFLAGDGTYKSGGLPMVILSYGNSTWADFEAAYNNNVIVYCRASSNSNPASGSQTRMAFMAYVNDSTSPTNVEFQYYRSVNSHSSSQMGDQVFVYKLDKTSGWSVTTREASIKQIKADTGTALGVSWNSNVVTLTNTMTANEMPMSSSDATTVGEEIDTLNGKITTYTSYNPQTWTSSHTILEYSTAYKYNRLVNLNINMTMASNVSAWATLITLPSELKPSGQIWVSAYDQANHNHYGLDITSGSGVIRTSEAITSGVNIVFSVTYAC